MVQKRKGKGKAVQPRSLKSELSKSVASLELIAECPDLCNKCQQIYINMRGLKFKWSNGEYGVYISELSHVREAPAVDFADSSWKCDHSFHRHQNFICMPFQPVGSIAELLTWPLETWIPQLGSTA